MNEWIGIPLVLGLLGALIVVLKVVGKRKVLHPEILRKALHVGMGCICMTFPWIFQNDAPVLALCICATATLLALKFVPALRTRFGGALHGVERLSLGEFYFIAGVAVLFLLAHENPGYYVLAMVWLTFADATAALIGVKYGTIRYATHDGRKSIEGSTSFAIVTYITTFMGLVALGRVQVIQDTLVSAIVGTLVMLLEAVAWDGIDNLVIPIFGFAILQNLLADTTLDLIFRATVLAGLFVATHYKRTKTTLADDALLGAILCGYVFWVLGGWPWLIAPAILFFKDKIRADERDEERRHDIHAIMAICGPSLICALGAHIAPQYPWLLASTVAFALNYALFHQMELTDQEPSTIKRIDLQAGARACLMVGGTYALYLLLFQGVVDGPTLFASPLLVMLGPPCFRLFQEQIAECPRDIPRWMRQSGVSGAGALCVLAIALRP